MRIKVGSWFYYNYNYAPSCKMIGLGQVIRYDNQDPEHLHVKFRYDNGTTFGGFHIKSNVGVACEPVTKTNWKLAKLLC